MTTNLYHIQDPDCPMHVVAASWQDAIAKWKARMADMNDCEPKDIEEPQGIAMVCDQDDLIL